MKKAFTLVELLIVILVLVALMSIVFRLASIGADTSARSKTINRLQRLENCLSGYYAAFGSYPAVRLHNSRNFRLRSGALHHTQSMNPNDEISGELNWTSVREACRAQPVGCDFPFPDDETWRSYVESISDAMVEIVATWGDSTAKQVFSKPFDAITYGRVSAYTDEVEWRKVQVFRFGLMSFLLPRYLFMLEGESSLYEDLAQWNSNNALPCDPMTGNVFGSWSAVQRYAKSSTATDLAHISCIPTQAVCARWIANLEGICNTTRSLSFYGVRVSETSDDANIPLDCTALDVHSLGDYGDDTDTSGQYLLDWVKVMDGWGNEFYYYSPEPYQSYVLWSGGPNGKTFPPWVDRETLDSRIRTTVEAWTADDIRSMSK